MRTVEDCQRLALDENMARRYYPNLEVRGRRGNICYTLPIRKSEYSKSYELKLELSSNHPHSKPFLFVESPKTLWLYKCKGTINKLGTSHDYHVYDNRSDGRVKICYTDNWNASWTCVKALHRGEIWIAAYEVHLLTGKTIAEIIDEWKDKLK